MSAPSFEHVCRHRVPHEMARSDLSDFRGHDVNAHRPRQMVAAERFALGCEEHREIVRLDSELRTRFAHVFFYPRYRSLGNRRVAVFLALAFVGSRSGRGRTEDRRVSD